MNDSSAPALLGHIDSADWHSVRGWAADPLAPGAVVLLDVWHGAQFVRRFAADRFRPDLLAAGVGSGHHGFDTGLPVALFEPGRVTLQLRDANSGEELAGSPFSLDAPDAALDRAGLGAIDSAIGARLASPMQPGELAALRTLLLTQLDAACQRCPGLAPEVPEGLQAAMQTLGGFAPLHVPAAGNPAVTILIVAGAFAALHRCLAALVQAPPAVSFEVVVVDAGGNAELALAALLLSGGIRLVRAEPVGRAAALAAGAAQARGAALVLLDGAADPLPGWLDALCHTLNAHPAIGIAGAALVTPDGTLHAAGGVEEGWVWRGQGAAASLPEFTHMADTAFVSSAAMIVRTPLFAPGLAPALMASGLAEAALCEQVRQAGHRVVVQPAARVVLPTPPEAPDLASALPVAAMQARQAFLASASPPSPRPAALVIDDTTPKPDHDAGSRAVLGHMHALQRLGYDVHFIPAIDMQRIGGYTAALERDGIRCYTAPAYESAEEVFRRTTVPYAVVDIHRLSNASRYLPLARWRFPRARLLYSVVDLHFLRQDREAALGSDPALQDRSARTRRLELEAAGTADRVVVYSTHEADLLRSLLPGATVRVVPWPVALRAPGAPGFKQRRGLAFIGGYAHAPNVDAAEWLVRDIMPLVWAEKPDIEVLLAGSAMPERVHRLAGPRVQALGHVTDLTALLDQVRLTVAPLRFGAGLKGKVLDSLAAGVPCVGTGCAFEGMGLPEGLRALEGETAAALAERVLRVHGGAALHGRLSATGTAFIAAGFSATAVDGLLQEALQG